MSAPDPNCNECGGTGSVPVPTDPPHPPQFRRCECALLKDLLENCERGLFGLSREKRIKSSPLLGKEGKDLWITEDEDFLAHLRHVALRKPPAWSFRVVSDAELVTAWLASISLKGGEIHDSDAIKISTRHMTIPDLVVPPDLLVVRMGVKVARNQAAHEVLSEALNTRRHEGKPTWIWDQPLQPLNAGHLFWSDDVARSLRRYERVEGLKTVSLGGGKVAAAPAAMDAPRPRRSLRRSLRGDT